MVHAPACAHETPAAPHITVIDGQPTTTSVQVAQHFKKRHADVMRAIRNLLQELPADRQRNFALIQIDVDLGLGRTRQDPAYRMTYDGFTLLAMGFTGREALHWKLNYMDAFRAMETRLAALQAPAEPAAPALAGQGDSIDVRSLLLSGQSEPVPLTPAQQALIDAHAWTLAREAYELTRQHLARRVSYQCARHLRADPASTSVAEVVQATTLGNALAHEYFTQIHQLESMARVLKITADQTLADVQHHAAQLGKNRIGD